MKSPRKTQKRLVGTGSKRESFEMPSSEEIFEAQDDVRERCIQHFVNKGHSRFSAEEIVRRMRYEDQAREIGQATGQPYSPY